MTQIGVVVLTQGTRPRELAAAFESLRAQTDVDLDIVCVGNGWQPTGLPNDVHAVGLPENVGIPAGRNAGVPHVNGELLFFLDDDARLVAPDTLARAAAAFANDQRLGLLQPRIDAVGGPTPSRWTPRIGGRGRMTSGPVFSVLEAAVMVRRSIFDQIDGWPGPFFYAHEGIEFAWRTWDTGHVTWYAADLAIEHPAVHPTRHADSYRLNARNRVWLARRNLPAVLRPIYVGSWLMLQVLRTRNLGGLRSWFGGLREGLRVDPGGQRVMSWRTVATMTRYGRPPII